MDAKYNELVTKILNDQLSRHPEDELAISLHNSILTKITAGQALGIDEEHYLALGLLGYITNNHEEFTAASIREIGEALGIEATVRMYVTQLINDFAAGEIQ